MCIQAERVAQMMEMLPEEEQNFAYEFVCRLIRAWDPDFTKLTPAEAKELEEARNGEFINSKEIDWDNPDNYAHEEN